MENIFYISFFILHIINYLGIILKYWIVDSILLLELITVSGSAVIHVIYDFISKLYSIYKLNKVGGELPRWINTPEDITDNSFTTGLVSLLSLVFFFWIGYLYGWNDWYTTVYLRSCNFCK